jgi:Short C-terminal domain
MAAPEPSAAQRLQELETLHATGVISDDEYTAKRQQIISEL